MKLDIVISALNLGLRDEAGFPFNQSPDLCVCASLCLYLVGGGATASLSYSMTK